MEHPQQIYHAYERGSARLFPTAAQIALTEDPENPRTLFINWKPQLAEWGEIAEGDRRPTIPRRLAAHIKANFDKPFFFTMHHEPENDVDPRPGPIWRHPTTRRCTATSSSACAAPASTTS